MTIIEIIERLSKEDGALVLPIGWENPHSYRGYYECLGVEKRENATVDECLDALRSAVGETYQGWKGGDFTMHEYTHVFLVAEEGCTGEKLTGTLLDLDIEMAKR